FWTICWDLRLRRLTMKPTPQASCSRMGSKRPDLTGAWKASLRAAAPEITGKVPFRRSAICKVLRVDAGLWLGRRVHILSADRQMPRVVQVRLGASAYPILSWSGAASKWPLVRVPHPASPFPFTTNGPAGPACALLPGDGRALCRTIL